MTLPSAAALTGSPGEPAIEMPMLRGAEKPWTTRPRAGHANPEDDTAAGSAGFGAGSAADGGAASGAAGAGAGACSAGGLLGSAIAVSAYGRLTPAGPPRGAGPVGAGSSGRTCSPDDRTGADSTSTATAWAAGAAETGATGFG
ncbi:hypothetical protein GCM10023089_09980 [Quisquiliibacterium transsilvanicum]